ncbi:uncharacterized protein LOC135845243 isoform X2 [Planococcus citri]|uniref:uncharacterized protein LOC135845243 isoform X2 n=1 Tax=Planococcus citri TaxID=170843 RepID=UPI0031F92D9B
MSESQGNKVQLYIYDLSLGLAQQLSQFILGKKIDGIWHTSIVAFGRELYFGSGGIVHCRPGTTNLGPPNEVYDLGTTDVTEDILDAYLDGLRESVFAIGTYDLLQHNCNTFSNELAQFLVGKSIPTHILELPNEITQALFSSTFPQVSNLLSDFVTSTRRTSPDFDELNNDIDAARQRSAQLEQKRNKIQAKIEKHEKKKKKKRNKNSVEFDLENSENYSQSSNSYYKSRLRKMSDNANGDAYQNGNGKTPADIAAEIEEQDKREREERRRQREPPIVFPNVVNLQEEFDKVIDLVDGNITAEEMQFFEELHQYLLEDEGSWAIGDGFLSFVGKLLSDQKFPSELRLRLLNVLAVAALKEDIILVLHQDRREHVFMNYAHNFDRLPIDEQKALALFVCNLFESPSSSEWLLYISEWDVGNISISNMRVTTKIAANSLLSENVDLQNYGTAIIHNLACKEVKSVVFDDVAVELTMAVLQFFNGKPEEEKLFRCMKALAKFVQVSQQDVSQLIQMIGPQPNSFRGTSERIDALIASIDSKLR